MKPKEKAESLIQQFELSQVDNKIELEPTMDGKDERKRYKVAKRCAIIAVDLALKCAQDNIYHYKSKISDKYYLLEVKKEIEKL